MMRCRLCLMRAHPRSRGENRDGVIDRLSIGGSSPLTRGKLGDLEDVHTRVRLIPAHAGKTRARPAPGGGSRAHPRSRGENTAYMRDGHPEMGSSPLTRGKHRLGIGCHTLFRLIPAHAGKTILAGIMRATTPAHPRSRGENRKSGLPTAFQYGSSPLTRGKRHSLRRVALHPRLIPAHAGKTRPPHERTTGSEAHPRSRGENVFGCGRSTIVPGSSPLTRGKLTAQLRQRPGERLIPAHAGKTPSMQAWLTLPAAHPRSRGENVIERGERVT